ncbi:hypothetical protein MRX96_045881 [Rhipicephalus microplus]
MRHYLKRGLTLLFVPPQLDPRVKQAPLSKIFAFVQVQSNWSLEVWLPHDGVAEQATGVSIADTYPATSSLGRCVGKRARLPSSSSAKQLPRPKLAAIPRWEREWHALESNAESSCSVDGTCGVGFPRCRCGLARTSVDLQNQPQPGTELEAYVEDARHATS